MGKQRKKAILIDVIAPDTSKEEAKKRLKEMESLVTTYGGVVVVKTIQRKSLPDYETYIGKGKLNEIIALGEEQRADLLIINNILKPRQIYNINEHLLNAEIKAWDRVDLILKIFSKHAQSTEAKLQIELASIHHMGPRIFDMGIELSRQAGAMGVRAGQGESNTEMMKRHLRKQEQNILKKLKHFETIREGHRKRRRRQNYKTAALVGYTNAGKSSLLNSLTGKGAYVADELFATLDTRVGKLYLQNTQGIEDGKYIPGKEVLISDTIGFIQNLPPNLIQAFKSTLAETVEADVILHVIDITDPEMHMKIQVVEEILEQLDAGGKPKLYIFNKIDLVKERVYKKYDREIEYKGMVKAGKGASVELGWATEEAEERKGKIDQVHDPKNLEKKYQNFSPVFISAVEKQNLDGLIAKIEKHIAK